MSLLENIQSGKQPMPPRIEIYGVEGIGKSSCAASAPNPVFLQTEDGLSEIDCRKFPLATSFSDVMEALNALYRILLDYFELS
ncbi:MAG: AAA family ATPase [Victivallaceae bacterium]|nr:AAA family ATPase [Victivallaceae bacterium]